MNQPRLRLALGGGLLVASIVIGVLVTLVGEPAFDERVVRACMDLRDGAVGATMRVASAVGYGRWLGPAALLIALAFAMRARRRDALVVAISTTLSTLVTRLCKETFERARPELADHVAAGFSMPSGHATSSAAFAMSIALAIHGRYAVPARIALVAFSLVVGSSRVVLGVHYPTDVVAGWLAGVGVALVVSALVDRPDRPSHPIA